MDYEKAYKEAINKLQEALSPTDGHEISGLTRRCIEEIFPELKESDEERIRKELISIVKSYRENRITEGNHRFDDCLAWLEKQGEKPVDSLDAKEEISLTITQDQMDDWLKKCVDAGKQDAWNDADEERFVSCLQRLGTGNIEQPDTINTMWLKSIKNRIQTIAKFVGEEQYMKGVRDGVNDVIKRPENYGLLPTPS